MADIKQMSAEARPNAGKGAARAVRREGRVPAVIYGDKQEPVTVSLNSNELNKLVNTGTFLSTLFEIEVDGKKSRVIPRDLQLDPVRDFPLHVDFLRLGKGATIAVEVQCNFLNEEESPGLKQGGVLNVVRYTLELVCPATEIPESIDIDLSGLELGDGVHISAITLPDGVTPVITDRDFTIATIASPAGLGAADDDEVEGEEGEEGEGEEGEEGEGEDSAEE